MRVFKKIFKIKGRKRENKAYLSGFAKTWFWRLKLVMIWLIFCGKFYHPMSLWVTKEILVSMVGSSVIGVGGD